MIKLKRTPLKEKHIAILKWVLFGLKAIFCISLLALLGASSVGTYYRALTLDSSLEIYIIIDLLIINTLIMLLKKNTSKFQ